MKMQARTEIGDKDIDLGLIRLYILHRAAIEPIDSREIVKRLDRHGLTLHTRSVSQILRGLEGKGSLVSARTRSTRQSQKTYGLTNQGRLAIKQARVKVRKLFALMSTRASD
jgi:PadR family transcriptional regulator PadR